MEETLRPESARSNRSENRVIYQPSRSSSNISRISVEDLQSDLEERDGTFLEFYINR
jgi:hypothetical protein